MSEPSEQASLPPWTKLQIRALVSDLAILALVGSLDAETQKRFNESMKTVIRYAQSAPGFDDDSRQSLLTELKKLTADG